MKDEVRGKIINEFAGFKSDMYSLVMQNDKEIKKAKGVSKNIVDNIRHEEYVDVLFGRSVMRYSMKRIQSKLHRIGTYVFKISLSCFDDKHYMVYDVNSSVYFHKDVLS